MSPDLSTSKSWLSKPDGKVGTTFAFILLAVAGFFVVANLAAITTWLVLVMSNIFTLGLLALGVVAIGFVLFDPRFRNLAFYGYKSLMRALTGMVIELDPIGILKTYISELQKKLGEMDVSIGNLKGQIDNLKRQVAKNLADVQHAMELMVEAKRQKLQSTVVLKEREKERLEKSNLALNDLLGRMDRLHASLRKMREGASIMIQDMSSEVDVKTRERKMLLAGYNAFNKARAVMAGSGDQREMFDQAMEFVTEDYGAKMGEIDQFMDASKGFLDGVDLANGIAASNADAAIDEWLNKSRIFGGPGLDAAPTNGTDVHLRVPSPPAAAPVSTGGEFDDLLTSSSEQQNERRN